MAHCAHVFIPSAAWAGSTEPKKRNRGITTRLGNAIRALKPGTKKFKEEQVSGDLVYFLNTDAAMEMDNCCLSRQPSEDAASTLSTQSGSSRCSSVCLSNASSPSSLASLSESVEELVLPGSVEEMSLPSNICKQTELHDRLHELANLLAAHAKSKFSGRVYQDVRNAFVAVDANGDGKLTPSEALAFCQHFDLPPKTTSGFFALLDHHETGLADWSSFLARYAPVFMKKSVHLLNGEGRICRPAIQ